MSCLSIQKSPNQARITIHETYTNPIYLTLNHNMLTWLTNAWDAMSLQLHPLQLHPLQLHRLQRHHLQLTRNFGARSTNLVKVLFFSIGASKVTTSSQQQRTWPSIERRSYAVLLVCPCGSGWSGLSGTSVCLCVKLDRVMAEAHDVV